MDEAAERPDDSVLRQAMALFELALESDATAVFEGEPDPAVREVAWRL